MIKEHINNLLKLEENNSKMPYTKPEGNTIVIELARLLLSGKKYLTQNVMSELLELPSVAVYQSLLYSPVTVKEIVMSEFLTAVFNEYILDHKENFYSRYKTSPFYAEWRKLLAEYYTAGRPLGVSNICGGEKAIKIEKLREQAKLSGTAWSRKFGMSQGTYRKRLEDNDISDNMLDIAEFEAEVEDSELKYVIHHDIEIDKIYDIVYDKYYGKKEVPKEEKKVEEPVTSNVLDEEVDINEE